MGWFYLTLVKRKRIRTIAVIVLVLCLLFIIYQMIIIYKLSSEELTSVNKLKLNSEHEIASQLKTISNKTSEKSDNVGLSAVSIKKLVKGVLFSDLSKYSPNAKGNFVCPVDKFEIIFSKVNDDYCDCPSDGSDEPGTNACQNGKFYCAYQSPSSSKPTFIPSSRVNDGICDCCDGSDEWNGFTLDGRLSESEQKRLGRYESPCSNFCK